MKNRENVILADTKLMCALRSIALFLFSMLIPSRVIFILLGERSILLVFPLSFAFYLMVRLLLKRSMVPSLSLRISNFLLCIACLYAMGFFIEPNRNIIWAVLFAFLYFLFHSVNSMSFEPLISKVSLFLAGIFSIAIFWGYQLVYFGRLETLYIGSLEELMFYSMAMWSFKLLGLIIFFYLLVYKLISLIVEKFHIISRQHSYTFKVCAAVPLLTGIFFICWLPYLAAYCPGLYHPDSLGEIVDSQYYPQISNHHAFLHPSFIKLCLMLGGASLQRGLIIYSVAQMLIQATIFSIVLVFLAKNNLSPWLLYPLGIFLATYMIIGLYSVYMIKDVLFACTMLLALLLLYRESLSAIRGEREGWLSLLGLIVVMFLLCISRNNGLHAFVIGFPLFWLCNRERTKRYAIAFLCVLVLVFGYKHLLYDALGVTKGRTAEMLSVPLQQIARTMKLNEAELDSTEAQVLREVFPNIEELGGLYKSHISDPVKYPEVFNSEVFDQNPGRYARAWLGLGLRNIRYYIDAMFLQCYGYFYPSLDVGGTVELSILEDIGIERFERSELMRSRISNSYFYYSSSHSGSILYSIGFAAWVIVFGVGVFFATGRAKLAAPCFLLLGKWLTILLSPVFCEFRYVYCLVICAPVVLVMALGLNVKARDGAERGI